MKLFNSRRWSFKNHHQGLQRAHDTAANLWLRRKTDLPSTTPVVSKPRMGMRQRHLSRILLKGGRPTSWCSTPTVLCTLLLDLTFACPYRHFFNNCIFNNVINGHRCIWNFFTYLSWKNASIISDIAFPHVWKMLTYFTVLILLDHEITGQNEITPGYWKCLASVGQ